MGGLNTIKCAREPGHILGALLLFLPPQAALPNFRKSFLAGNILGWKNVGGEGIRDKAEPASHVGGWLQELRRLCVSSSDSRPCSVLKLRPSSFTLQPQALIRLQCTALLPLPIRVLEAESRSDLSLCFVLSCFKNSSVEMLFTCKKLHVLTVYNVISFDICLQSWHHHHNQENEHVHHCQIFPPATL